MEMQVNFWTVRDAITIEASSLRGAVEKLVAQRIDLSGANLSGANLFGANLFGADLSGANLSGANLFGANLFGADLSRADLFGARLSGADLSRARLSGANLSGADLYRANLSGANLSGADLSGANLSGADLSGANLSGADLSGANLSGAKYGERVLWKERPLLLLGPCGSRNDRTRVFFFEDKSEPEIRCGCFTGNLAEFAAKIEETHGGGFFAVEYAAVVAHIKAIREMQLADLRHN